MGDGAGLCGRQPWRLWPALAHHSARPASFPSSLQAQHLQRELQQNLDALLTLRDASQHLLPRQPQQPAAPELGYEAQQLQGLAALPAAFLPTEAAGWAAGWPSPGACRAAGWFNGQDAGPNGF